MVVEVTHFSLYSLKRPSFSPSHHGQMKLIRSNRHYRFQRFSDYHLRSVNIPGIKILRDVQSNVVHQLNCCSCSETYNRMTIMEVCFRLKERDAPQLTPPILYQGLRQSTLIAATTKILYTEYDSDSRDDRKRSIT